MVSAGPVGIRPLVGAEALIRLDYQFIELLETYEKTFNSLELRSRINLLLRLYGLVGDISATFAEFVKVGHP